MKKLLLGLACLAPMTLTAVLAQDAPPAPLPPGESRAFPPPRTVEGQSFEVREPERKISKPAFKEQTRAPYHKRAAFQVTTLTDKLGSPWALAFLPGDKLLITERRPGALRVLDASGKLSDPLAGLEALAPLKKLGVLDVALAPDFAVTRRIYLSFFESVEGGFYSNTNLATAILSDDLAGVRDVKVLFRGVPAVPLKNFSAKQGGRIVFGKDGSLFMIMGDRDANRKWDYLAELAQKLDNHLGKVIHIMPDGKPAPGNPFLKTKGALPEIWATGLRSPQGFAADPKTGQFWEVEHGPQGGDELNLIRKGRNYGWPVISYGINYTGEPIRDGIAAKKGMEQPVYYWDPVIAPSGMAFYQGDLFPAWKGSLFVSGLRGIGLFRLELKNGRVVAEEPLLQDLKLRMRDVRVGPDGAVYALAERGKLFKLTPQ